MESLLNTFLVWLNASKYVFLVVGTIFEGPVVMVASGFLYRLGSFDLLPMYLALVAGDFTADIGWYTVGRFGGRPFILKFGNRFGITDRAILKIQDRFHRYHDKILIISKLTMGFGFALVTLVVAGMLHVPFKKYVVLNLLGGFIWTAMLIALGYFFGNIFDMFTGIEKIIVAVCGFVLFVCVIKIGTGYLSEKNI